MSTDDETIITTRIDSLEQGRQAVDDLVQDHEDALARIAELERLNLKAEEKASYWYSQYLAVARIVLCNKNAMINRDSRGVGGITHDDLRQQAGTHRVAREKLTAIRELIMSKRGFKTSDIATWGPDFIAALQKHFQLKVIQ